MSFRIKKVFAREILDSRGNPTVECDVVLRGGVVGRAAVPSGASTGRFEAVELRDGGKRFHGLGVLSAVKHVNSEISGKLAGLDCRNQREIDSVMVGFDGSPDKSVLGANAILPVSLAVARAAASASEKPLYMYLAGLRNDKHRKGSHFVLPVPFCNIVNGGKHAANELSVQELMIVPAGLDSFSSSIAAVSEVYHQLRELLLKKFGKPSVNVGDEGGFAPAVPSAEEAFSLMESAVAAVGYTGRIRFALDAAASEFYVDKKKKYCLERGRFLSAEELADYYLKLAGEFPIVSVEDPFEQNAFDDFAKLAAKLGRRNVQVVGDDLLVTSCERVQQAVQHRSCTCLLLKPNQAGTLSESLDAAQLAFEHGWNVMVSHRSGETEDAFIADLALALGCGQIKAGAPTRSERTAKYNRLLRIEEELESLGKAHVYGKSGGRL